MAISTINWLTLLVIVGGDVHQSFQQRTCSFKFSLMSYDNQTGVRKFTVGPESKAKSRGQVILDVNHWTGMCECADSVGEQVTIPSPPITMPTPALTTRKPVTDCWPKYELLPGAGCYKDVNNALTWRKAQSICVAEGSQLAVPKSQEEMDFFKKIVALDGYNHWVGIHKGEQWLSVQGSVFPLNSSFWASGFPRDDNGECVFVAAQGLYNYRCNAVRRFFCQQP